MKDLSPNEGFTYLDGVEATIALLKNFEVDLRTALRYGRDSYSFDDICRMVLQGKLLFYPLPNSVMICEVTDAPNFRTLHIFLAAGNLDELLTDGEELVMAEAAKYGCKYVSLAGRTGWRRALTANGWGNELSIMYKEVGHEQDD